MIRTTDGIELTLKQLCARLQETGWDPVFPYRTALTTKQALAVLSDVGLLPSAVDPTGGDLSSRCAIRYGLCRLDVRLDLAWVMQGLSTDGLHGSSHAPVEKCISQARSGETVGSFALTELNAGSDLRGIETTLARTASGWRLNGTKTYLTHGATADFYTVLAKVDAAGDDDPGSRFALVVVPASIVGVERRAQALVASHPMGTVRFANVEVCEEQIVTCEDGMKSALRTLSRFRPTVGAAAMGLARRAWDEAYTYCCNRTQGGRVLSDNRLVQMRLVDARIQLETGEALLDRAVKESSSSGQSPSGLLPIAWSSMAKLQGTESAQQVIDTCVQLHGARGLDRNHTVAHLHTSIRAMRIYEGASDVQRHIIMNALFNSR